MNISISYGQKEISLKLPQSAKIEIVKQPPIPVVSDPTQAVVQALENPFGAPLHKLAAKYNKALIIVTDFTRILPYPVLLPPVIEELRKANISDENISFFIASGTHRPMSETELQQHLGREITERYKIHPHEWWKPSCLASVGVMADGTPITVNRLLMDDAVKIGVGIVKPHRNAGWSGGSKIIQPGASGLDTTGATHWQAAQYKCEEILGVEENPVRREMDEIAAKVDLDFIVNTVQDETHQLAFVAAGDFIAAHRACVNYARPYYVFPFKEEADIFIAGTSPVQQSIWAMGSGPNWAEMMVRQGGTLLQAGRCLRGICPEHPEVEQYGYLPLSKVQSLVSSGELKDLAAASHIQHGGEKMYDKNIKVDFFCEDLDKGQINHMGFGYISDFQESLDKTLEIYGPKSKIFVYPGYDFTTLIPKAEPV